MHRDLRGHTLGYMVLSPLALSLPQDTSCSPIMVQKLDVAPQAACISGSHHATALHCAGQPSCSDRSCAG